MGSKIFQRYDKKVGQNQFRNDINGYLKNYKDGFELEVNGEIAAVCDTVMEELINSKVPEYNTDNVEAKIDRAIKKYKSRHSSDADKKDAVRDLVDVLEFIRPELKGVLFKQEENELFIIANKFAIRHHNESQKTDYGSEFIDWIFFAYLSTIHLSIKQLKKYK
jgi:acylphosphatase